MSMKDLLIRQSPSPIQSRETTSLSSADLESERNQEHNCRCRPSRMPAPYPPDCLLHPRHVMEISMNFLHMWTRLSPCTVEYGQDETRNKVRSGWMLGKSASSTGKCDCYLSCRSKDPWWSSNRQHVGTWQCEYPLWICITNILAVHHISVGAYEQSGYRLGWIPPRQFESRH